MRLINKSVVRYLFKTYLKLYIIKSLKISLNLEKFQKISKISEILKIPKNFQKLFN